MKNYFLDTVPIYTFVKKTERIGITLFQVLNANC